MSQRTQGSGRETGCTPRAARRWHTGGGERARTEPRPAHHPRLRSSSLLHLALPLIAVLMLVPATAAAQSDAQGLRLRFGAGADLGWFGTSYNAINGNGLVGAYLRLGAQWNRYVGTHLTLAASMILFQYARSALVVDVSPTRWLSVGTGLAGAVTSYWSFERDDSFKSVFIGAPLALTFFFPGGTRASPAKEELVGLTLTGMFGYAQDYDTPTTRVDKGFGAGATLSFGFERR